MRSPTVRPMLPDWVSPLLLLVTLPLSSRAALEVWRGHKTANPVSWTLWAIGPAIAAAAAWAAGSGLAMFSTLATGLGPALVALAALAGPHRRGKWPVTRSDLTFGAMALLAMVGWIASGEPLVAVMLAVAADALAAVPSVKKVWVAPASESPWGYVAGTTSGVTGLLTVQEASLTTLAFPIYIVLLCVGVLVLIGRPGPRRQRDSATV